MDSENIIHADGTALKQAISANEVVLVDFWASWCAPCRAMAPLIDRLASEFPAVKIIKVDAERHEDLLSEYEVQSLPTLQVYRSGMRVEQLRGKVPYTLMQRALQN
ncbi:thioredoxin family protein [Shinella sp.]|uniref:thioredoxin family protein n=1 Tax=Shinella sp. TaxID=1870904 RepID=UPI003F72E07F